MDWDLKKIKSLEDLKKLKSVFYSPTGDFEILKNKIKHTNDPIEKRNIGLKLSEIKRKAENFFLKAQENLRDNAIKNKIRKQRIDVSIPFDFLGGFHPISLVKERFRT